MDSLSEYSLFLSAEREDHDTLWLQSAAHFPFQPGFSETHVRSLTFAVAFSIGMAAGLKSQVGLRGRSWCIVEEEDDAVSCDEPTALQAWIKRNPGLSSDIVSSSPSFTISPQA